METLHIGLLLPSSTILPISKQFEKGLNTALATIEKGNIEIEITKEFIGPGGTPQVENAINKLLNYDAVDMVTGIVSSKVLENFATKFKSAQKPCLINNLGEHVPDLNRLNSHTFINSMHLWKDAFALGNWGVKTFGKKGMFIASVYDAGYSFSQMFHEGMMAADATAEWSFSVPPMPPAGQLSDMSVIFPFLDQYQPDFVFAAFCGTEATLFINEFIKRGWHKKTKLMGLPYLLYPFEPLLEDITIYTTQLSTQSGSIDIDKCIYQLGYQTGNVIQQATETDGENIYQKIINTQQFLLLENTNFLNSNNLTSSTTTIVQHNINAGGKHIDQKVMFTASTFSVDNASIKSLTNEISVGWLNPYLCI